MIEWTFRKKNLLLYFETRLVDNYGIIDHRHTNAEERKWAETWESEEKLITFNWSTGEVTFTEAAWKLAHQFRKERSERMIKNRGK